MNTIYSLLLLLLLLVICKKEGFDNIYNNNNIPLFEPDDTQYLVCMNSINDNDKLMGNNNYKKIKNKIEVPLDGTYSTFIDMFQLRKQDNFYYSPICEDTYPFKQSYIDIFDRQIIEEDEDVFQLLNKEKELDEIGLHNPYYLYGNPKSIQNKITYDGKLRDIFLNTRNHLISDEEDIQTRQQLQRYFINP